MSVRQSFLLDSEPLATWSIAAMPPGYGSIAEIPTLLTGVEILSQSSQHLEKRFKNRNHEDPDCSLH